jgi:anti-anti-sigma factor
MTNFGVRVDERDGEVRFVLSDEFDLSAVEQVEHELRRAEERRPALLVFDLRGLTFLDSSGLRVITSAYKRAEAEGRRLVLIEGPEIVMRVFRITQLDQRLEIVSDPSAVIAES